jgi:hypothetical protein
LIRLKAHVATFECRITLKFQSVRRRLEDPTGAKIEQFEGSTFQVSGTNAY